MGFLASLGIHIAQLPNLAVRNKGELVLIQFKSCLRFLESKT